MLKQLFVSKKHCKGKPKTNKLQVFTKEIFDFGAQSFAKTDIFNDI